jgi:hypothetical protein
MKRLFFELPEQLLGGSEKKSVRIGERFRIEQLSLLQLLH